MAKILVVAAAYPYPEHRDGLAKINANLILDNPYFETDMLCIQDINFPEPERCRFFKVEKIPVKSKLRQALAYSVLNKPFNVLKLSAYINIFRIFILENHDEYDVIHLSSPYLAEIICGLPQAIADKILLFPIDSMTLYWERRKKAEFNLVKKLIYQIELYKCIRFEKKYYKKFKKTIFVSDVDRDFAKHLVPGSSCFSIPNGVDVEYFRGTQGSSVEKNSLIFTGDMSYAPNRDAAYFLVDEVLPRIALRFKPHLFLVGQRPDERLKNLNLSNVTVTGFVEDLRPYLAAAAVYISPLRYGSGIKNKVLEAMAMERVVIGTKISFDGIECAPGQDCIVVSADPDEIAKEIEKVFSVPCNYHQIAKRARLLVEEKYSWDSIRKTYGQLYENSISNR